VIRVATIVFDVDGTLIDSAADIHSALNFGLVLAGCAEIDFAASRLLISFGLERSLEAVLAQRGFRMEAPELARIKAECVRYYDAHLVERTRLYPGVEETLEALRRAGAVLGICTNKRPETTAHILSEFGIAGYFGALVARGTVPEMKPHPAPLLAAIHALGGRCDSAAMVGDSALDIDCARAARVASVAVAYGYSDRPVGELGADRVVDFFHELPAVLGAIPRPG
jgi:phosphoglycolate phosphatase